MKGEFHGRGASHPFEVSTTGGIRESASLRKIEESLRIILGTQHGERVMRPTFGANLGSLVFAPDNESTASLARHYVGEALQRWEPRIEVTELKVESKNAEAMLLIHITYRVKATHEVRSMVYPFYLESA